MPTRTSGRLLKPPALRRELAAVRVRVAAQPEPDHGDEDAEDNRIGAKPPDDGQRADHRTEEQQRAERYREGAPAIPSAHSCSITLRSLMALAISSPPVTMAHRAITPRKATAVEAGHSTATMPAAM